MKYLIVIIFFLFGSAGSEVPDADWIIQQVDANMTSENRSIKAEMIIHGKRKSRTITSQGYAEGFEKSFSGDFTHFYTHRLSVSLPFIWAGDFS